MSFTLLKERFYGRFDDLTLFDCRPDLNVVKCGLEAAQFADQRSASTASTSLTMQPLAAWARLVAGWARRPKSFVPRRLAGRQTLIVVDEPRRTQTSNGSCLTYFHRIVEAVSECDRAVVGWLDTLAPGEADYVITSKWRFFPTAEAMALKRDLLACHDRLRSTARFSADEIRFFEHALGRLWTEYCTWAPIFRMVRPQTICVQCHYHKEGLIYAARRLGIKVVELQHGLIDPCDVFYCLPKALVPVRARALFPDRILTYGPYWSRRLLEGHEVLPSQIDCVGYYLQPDERTDADTVRFCSTGRTIMVATQPRTTAACRHYVRRLLAAHAGDDDVRILVRPHPAEEAASYAEFSGLPKVRVASGGGIDRLLPLVSAVVSVFSTVLFDSIRHGVPSYAISDEYCADYVRSIVATGAVGLLEPGQSPFDARHRHAVPKKEDFYADFRPDVLLQHLLER